ncbi:MAG: alpha/beta hydrolase [Kiritimatiellae bacterium]|nr:alpha/beta hydrolase [Kiritimatiellia bacterium]
MSQSIPFEIPYRSETVNVNGTEINYYRSGGHKPPIILCHGFSDSGLAWLRTAEVLEKDYDLIMFDARGHGASGRIGPGFSEDDRSRDLADLVKALNLNGCAGIGHSIMHPVDLKAIAYSRKCLDPNLPRHLKRIHFLEYVKNIRCPGLLMYATGTKPGVVNADSAERVKNTWNGCTLCDIPDGGHNIRGDKFDLYVNNVSDYLNRMYVDCAP